MRGFWGGKRSCRGSFTVWLCYDLGGESCNMLALWYVLHVLGMDDFWHSSKGSTKKRGRIVAELECMSRIFPFAISVVTK